MTRATREACAELLTGDETVVEYRPGRPFRVGQLRVEPFLTVHDAADPVGVAVVDEATGLRLGVATDLGRPTAQIRHALTGCDLLVLEANHDEVLLHTGPYPTSVKRRIASSHGHLSNQAAARLATELLHPRLAGVVLAHLSFECNRPVLAERVVGDALRAAGWRGHLEVALQDRPSRMLDLEELRLRAGPSQLSLL
jgi:phosphoribosyl 1,2-cyclic phosphodiesterase